MNEIDCPRCTETNEYDKEEQFCCWKCGELIQTIFPPHMVREKGADNE